MQKVYGGTMTVYAYDIFGLAAEYNSAGTWARDFNRLTERIQRLGFDVQLTPRPLPPAISPVLEG